MIWIWYLQILKILFKLYLQSSHHDILTSSPRNALLTCKDLSGPSLYSWMFLHWLENIMFTENRRWMTHCVELYPERGWNQSSHIQRVKWNCMEMQDVKERTWTGCTLYMYRDFLNYLWLRGESCFCFLKECTK